MVQEKSTLDGKEVEVVVNLKLLMLLFNTTAHKQTRQHLQVIELAFSVLVQLDFRDISGVFDNVQITFRDICTDAFKTLANQKTSSSQCYYI